MKESKKVFRLAELFCGPGGLALGAIGAKVITKKGIYTVEPIWANDIDPDTCKTYARNIHGEDESKVYCCPVETLNYTKLPPYDALAFGFPCNDFSIVGEQKGFSGKYGPLYTYGIKAINHAKPLWFMAENVGGLKSANNGLALKKILKDLANAGSGYNITAHLYKFEEYGVPQYRRRIVIVGIRKDQDIIFKVPAPITKKHISAYDAIEGCPIDSLAPNNERTQQSSIVVERLKYIPQGENAWYPNIPEHLRLNVKSAKMSQIYKRLIANKPAYTITGSGGGGTHVYHWSENRALTNRERARIQTFPDSFIFEGSKESVRKQIGMAVPPIASKVIVEAVLKTFANIDYRHVRANIDIETEVNENIVEELNSTNQLRPVCPATM